MAKSVKKAEETVTAPPAVISQPVPEVIKEKTPEETTPVEIIGDTVESPQAAVEELKTEVKEAALPYAEPVQVERIPEVVEQVQIPTH